MAQAVNNSSGIPFKPFTPEDDANLREGLKRCSAATYEAAAQFREALRLQPGDEKAIGQLRQLEAEE